MAFKNSFVKELKELIPVLPTKLYFPKHQGGYIRFNNGKLHSVYLESLKDNDNSNIILKFIVNENHHWLFSDIYVCGDDCNELRFDKDLKFNARYLKGISIPAELDVDMKLHLLEILVEWQRISKVLGEHNYISEYQVEKEGVLVKNAYAVFAKKLNPELYHEANSMVKNFDINKTKYFQKIKIKENKVTKENDIYLIIQNKYEQ